VLFLGCGLKDPAPFDPVAMQRMFRDRAAENVTPAFSPLALNLDKTYLVKKDGNAPTTRSANPLPTTAESVGPVVRMSLRDLVQLAAVNSLQVRVSNYQPAIDEARVIEAEARFDPSFFTNVNFATQTLLSPTPQATSISPTSRTDFQTTTVQTGFKQTLDNGAQVQLQYQGTQTFRRIGGETQPWESGIYESGLSLQITQPLLQNFGTEVNRARVVVARNTQRVSLLDARLQLEKTLSEIEELYWQLVDAERELAIQQDLYNETVKTADILQRRAGQDVTRVQLSQNNAALRQREVLLVTAQNEIKRLSHEIKRRVNDPSMPVASAVVILPDDHPVEAPIKFDLAEQIQAALSNRAELAQQQIRIDSATVVYKAAQNNVLPQLNLVGSVGIKGAAANSFGHAVGNELYDNEAQEYAIGLQLEVPLGNREARAILQRTGLQRLQAIYQYKDLIEQVTQETKEAFDQVYSSWERLGKARQSLYAAQDALDALQQEQDVGNVPLTPDFINRKLNAQEVLAQARRDDARAASDYNIAIAALERAKGTLLKYDNVLMAQEPLMAEGVRVSRKQD
jgi:outer membrane protein TolC